MVRVGKWDEQKVLFKNRGQGGHDHFGGTRGAHIAAGALGTQVVNANKNLGTGALQYVATGNDYSTNHTKRLMFVGTLTKTALVAASQYYNMGGATGWTAIEYSRVCSRSGFGTAAGGAEGTVDLNYFFGATLFLSATLGIETAQANVLMFGY